MDPGGEARGGESVGDVAVETSFYGRSIGRNRKLDGKEEMEGEERISECVNVAMFARRTIR